MSLCLKSQLLRVLFAGCACASTGHGQVMWEMLGSDVSKQDLECQSERSVEKNKLYSWRKGITATVFWVGEDACAANPVHNHASSWDREWRKNFGGKDTPHQRKGYFPKAFVPRQNPFYIALPYNDLSSNGVDHKPEAKLVIDWFKDVFQKRGRSVCKGRWVAVEYRGKICYAQWEDCGPFYTDDWQYVFKGMVPKKNKNNNAGIDVSPAVRDFLGLRSGEKVAWKFVESDEVALQGPWARWNNNSLAITKNP